jgi:hypothetical protein
MSRFAALLILLALLQPSPDPGLRARWDSATSATITWTQAARGCLSVTHATNEHTFIDCYEQPGSYRIEFGHVGPLSGDLRPTGGDIYRLETGGQVYRAPLIARPVYMPVHRR